MSDDAPPFYSFLEVGTDASTDKIQEQYRKLVKTYHPDQGGSNSEFKKLKSARDTLTSFSERRRYDRLGHDKYVRVANPGGWETARSTDESAGEEDSSSAHDASTDEWTTSEQTSHSDRRYDSTNASAGHDQTTRDSTSGSSSETSTGQSWTENESETTGQKRTTGAEDAGWGQSDQSTSNRSSTTTSNKGHTGTASNSGWGSTNVGASTSTSTTETGGYRHSPSGPANENGSGYPRTLAGIVLSYLLSFVFGYIGGISGGLSVSMGVAVGFGFVFGRDVLSVLRETHRSAPALDPDDAMLYALLSGIGPVILLAAIAQGSVNGGLMFSRFAGVFIGAALLPVGLVTGGAVFWFISSPLLAIFVGAFSSLTLFVIEFTPYRFWIPFGAIENEPASVIAPWVSVGPVAGFTPGWAINFGLAIVLFYSLVFGLLILLLGFSDLLRDGATGGVRVLGWDLFAAAPFILLTTWVLTGNTLWALWSVPPATTTAAGIVIVACVWPSVVFVTYAIVGRVGENLNR